MSKGILLVFILFSQYSLANMRTFSATLSGRILLDYMQIGLDSNWDNTRYYKDEFLDQKLAVRGILLRGEVGYGGFKFRSALELHEEKFSLEDIYLEYQTFSKNFDMLLGQFSHEECYFYGPSHESRPMLEKTHSKVVFYRNSCRGLGFRLRYRKNHWALASSIKVPEISKFTAQAFEKRSLHSRIVISPVKYDNFFAHIEASYLWQQTKNEQNFYSKPGIFTEENAQIIRTDFLPNSSYSILNMGLQTFLFKQIQFETNYSFLFVTARETTEMFNKNLMFPSFDLGIFYHWGVQSFSYSPFKGFYNFKPYYARAGILQFGFSYQIIQLTDGKRKGSRGNTGVEGGLQTTYKVLLAWQANPYLKIIGSYFLTIAKGAKSILKRKGTYNQEDWVSEAQRPISGIALRLKLIVP